MMETILYFLTYFVIYSFAGWVLESVSKSIAQKKLVKMNTKLLNLEVKTEQRRYISI